MRCDNESIFLNFEENWIIVYRMMLVNGIFKRFAAELDWCDIFHLQDAMRFAN